MQAQVVLKLYDAEPDLLKGDIVASMNALCSQKWVAHGCLRMRSHGSTLAWMLHTSSHERVRCWLLLK